VLKNGIRRAEITELSNSQYIRVEIKNIRWDATPGQHAYIYFPTLNPLRALENHPFSLIPSSMLRSYQHNLTGGSSSENGSEHGDVEKHLTSMTAHLKCSEGAAGLTFFIRKSEGITKLLKNHSSALTLLDGPYSNNSKSTILRCDRLLLIAGGVGVTGLLPWVNTHPNVKFYWGLKQSAECLTHALETALHNVAEKEVRIDQRFDVRALIQQEAESGWAKIGVVVCGPGGLCDDVRAAVVEAGRKGPAIIDLQVDAYSW
jgi:predicted ferric reductase